MSYLRRKLLFYLLAVWAAVSINFLVPRLIPGSPVDALLVRMSQAGATITPATRHSLELMLGFDSGQSWVSQYFGYLGGLVRGDFGTSVTYFPTSVSTVLAQSLPWTVVLIGVSTVLSFLIGTGLGAVAGWRRGSWL